MTTEQRTQIIKAVVGVFGAAPGATYLDELSAYAGNPAALIQDLTTTGAFTFLYPSYLTNEEFSGKYLDSVLGAAVSDADKAWAVEWMTAGLEAGQTRGQMVLAVLTALSTVDIADEHWGAAAQQLHNKTVIAEYYTVAMGEVSTDLATLQGVLANVDNDTDVTKPEEVIDGGTVTPSTESIKLTLGMDDLTGTAGDDTFVAKVGQNELGAQANTLGSGDEIDGGDGADMLAAKVAAGVFLGGSWSMPVQPETESVETIQIEAVISDIGNLGNLDETANDQVFINAKDMEDVHKLSSNHSDADLTIMNLTTKGLNQLSDMTIGMEYTGNADSKWDESDMHVYFDQDYLTPEATVTDPFVDFLAMNEDNYDSSNGAKPLEGVFFRELQFDLNGETFDLTEYLGEDPEGAGDEITTYAEFLAAVQAALVELKADNADNAALQSVEASFGQIFTTDVNPETGELRQGVGVRLTVDGKTGDKNNTLTISATDLEVARAADSEVPNNNRYEKADATPPVGGEKLAINVDLEKVGLAGDGGELVIGSMNKHEDNTWDASNTVVDSTTAGIDEFNVTVYGDNTKSSSLSGLHSTNNTLRVVTIATDEALTGDKGYANLTIGNSNTDGLVVAPYGSYENALKDVQTLDASAFKGDLTVFAGLTEEVTAKYLNLVDEAADAPKTDNVDFAYTGGIGNDTFNVTLDADNLAAPGTATREDFTLNIDGGNGDDAITLAIVQDAALADASNWYTNQALNKNLSIDGGAGDDTISTPGSGNVIIDAGTGNDTVYADNTGAKAVWVLNAEVDAEAPTIPDLDDLESDANDTYNLFKTDVKVTFMGFEATADIADSNGKATDLDINQAIKKAINNDAVLSKLLLAEDGPANTLVLTSLIDGEMSETLADEDINGVTIELVAPAVKDITATDATLLSKVYNQAGLTPETAQGLIDAVVEDFNTANDTYVNQLANADLISGNPSDHTSDNTITGGLGDDVIVLGTGDSNDTVKYEDFGNGRDSIVNFTASMEVAEEDVFPANGDYLDLSSYDAVAVKIGDTWYDESDTGIFDPEDLEEEDKYIVFTESATNDGQYTVEVWEEAGAKDTKIGVIGVLDFGIEQAFVADNFIL
ncbi:MAG: hypothetical protein EOM08_10845 [Clostridia bacterium]|nr:hypothetical protein [Clostridia bacterium]